MPFLCLATSAGFAMPREADYVVVGAGTAGSLVAARLARHGFSVTVLDPSPPLSHLLTPDFRSLEHEHTSNTTGLYYPIASGLENDLETSVNSHNLWYGKMLGGSSSHNGGLYFRGALATFANWGLPGWSESETLARFLAFEHAPSYAADGWHGDNPSPGAGVPLVRTRHSSARLDAAIQGAMSERAGIPARDDYLDSATPYGFSLQPWRSVDCKGPLIESRRVHLDDNATVPLEPSVAQGYACPRSSAYFNMLAPTAARRDANVRIMTGHAVERVVFEQPPARSSFGSSHDDEPRAIGVMTRELAPNNTWGAACSSTACSSTSHNASRANFMHGTRFYGARRGVILAAGAVQTPTILVRSGIGARADVERMGAELVVENEHVGRHLIDQPSNTLSATTESYCEADASRCDGLDADTGNAIYGWINGTAAETPVGIATAAPSWGELDCEIAILTRLTVEGGLTVALKAWLGRPSTEGHVIFPNTDDPSGLASVSLHYLRQPEERARYLACLRRVYDGFNHPSLVERFGNLTTHIEPSPAVMADDAAAIEWILRHLIPGDHAVGTARMSTTAETGVVDPSLRVHGVTGLHVADLSAAPTSNGGHTQSLAYVLAQRLAEDLLGPVGGNRVHEAAHATAAVGSQVARPAATALQPEP